MKKRELVINITNNPEDFSTCALMMSETEPWITLGMNYDKCLIAFEGACKEIYTARIGKDIAGFVILQVCGSFSGYIQTICIREDYREWDLEQSSWSFARKEF
jgi:hypothetical protein